MGLVDQIYPKQPDLEKIFSQCIENKANKKMGTPLQFKTTNIPGFQFLETFRLKDALLYNLKTYIYW